MSALIERAAVIMPALALLALSGCATRLAGFPATGQHDFGLDRWIDDELAPYLVDELGSQPRFKGEPVLLVSMEEADIRPDIDGLSREIRARLMDHLLQADGPTLIWHPSTRPWQHRDTRRRTSCNAPDRARYNIGISITPLSNGEYRVAVRALEVGTTRWVSGFGRHWQGRLSKPQQHSRQTTYDDDYLRGLRVLPFHRNETDLLANYLGNQLDCLLRHRVADVQRIFVTPDARQDPLTTRLSTLTAYYLAQQSTAVLTDDPASADLHLDARVMPIDTDLQQVWLTARALGEGDDNASITTNAYIHAASVAKRGDNGSSTRQDIVAPAKPTRRRLLSPPRLLRSTAPGQCRSIARRATDPETPIRPDECFNVVIDLLRPAHLFTLRHDTDGRLVRTGCENAGLPASRHAAGQKLVVDGTADGPLQGAARRGVESIYAIATADRPAAMALERQFGDLPMGCGPPASPISDNAKRHWLSRLQALLETHTGHVEWQGMRIQHAGYGTFEGS